VTSINTNTLLIPDVRLSDDNTYNCAASNEGGSITSSTSSITIRAVPIMLENSPIILSGTTQNLAISGYKSHEI